MQTPALHSENVVLEVHKIPSEMGAVVAEVEGVKQAWTASAVGEGVEFAELGEDEDGEGEERVGASTEVEEEVEGLTWLATGLWEWCFEPPEEEEDEGEELPEGLMVTCEF